MNLSWKNILLGGSLLFLFFLLFALFLTSSQIQKTEERQEIRTRAAAATILSFSPASLTIAPNQTFTLNILINTGTNRVTAAEIQVTFDNTKLQAQSISPGSFLTTVLLPGTIDQARGKASITLGSGTTPQQGSSTLVTLTFKATNPTGNSPTNIVLNGSQVAAIGEPGNVITQLSPAYITIANASLSFNIKPQGITTQKPNKTARVILKQQDQEKYRFDNVSIASNPPGTYSGTVTNIIPGTYDVYIKSWVHLQKKFAAVTLNPGTNTQDFSSVTLKAGDAIDNNRIDIYDYNKVVEHFGPRRPAEGSIADFDLDDDVDIFDYNYLVSNFNQVGD